MNKFMAGVKRFLSEEEGLETVEYALIAGLVVAAGAAIYATLGGTISTIMTELNTCLSTGTCT